MDKVSSCVMEPLEELYGESNAFSQQIKKSLQYRRVIRRLLNNGSYSTCYL